MQHLCVENQHVFFLLLRISTWNCTVLHSCHSWRILSIFKHNVSALQRTPIIINHNCMFISHIQAITQNRLPVCRAHTSHWRAKRVYYYVFYHGADWACGAYMFLPTCIHMAVNRLRIATVGRTANIKTWPRTAPKVNPTIPDYAAAISPSYGTRTRLVLILSAPSYARTPSANNVQKNIRRSFAVLFMDQLSLMLLEIYCIIWQVLPHFPLGVHLLWWRRRRHRYYVDCKLTGCWYRFGVWLWLLLFGETVRVDWLAFW